MGGQAMIPFQSLYERTFGKSLCRLLAAVLLCSVATVAPGQDTNSVDSSSGDETAEAPVPFALRPYRVQLSIAVHQSKGSRGGNPKAIAQSVYQALSRMYGRMWQMEMLTTGRLTPGTPVQIRRLSKSDLISTDDDDQTSFRFPEAVSDKIVFVGLQASSSGIEIACREYDTRLQTLSPAQMVTVDTPFQVPVAAARLVRDVFRPCLQYVRKYTDDDGLAFIELQTQAGELPASDITARQIREDDVLRLFIRRMDRRDTTKLKQLNEVPLNYVRVLSVDESVTRGLTTGVLLSHSRVSPFGSRARSVQHLALRQRPVAQSSTVRLVERSAQENPLICQRIAVAYKLRANEVDEQDQLKLLSDRNGDVTIPVHPDFPTMWIYVYSGARTLARVPYAPGIVPMDTIHLPDDSIRLSVEGDLKMFQDRLVDSVALREVQFSLARQATRDGRADDLEQILGVYGKMPGREKFLDDLTLIRVSAERRAEESRNRFAKRDVQNLCRDVEETIELFFNDSKRVARMEAIARMREEVGPH